MKQLKRFVSLISLVLFWYSFRCLSFHFVRLFSFAFLEEWTVFDRLGLFGASFFHLLLISFLSSFLTLFHTSFPVSSFTNFLSVLALFLSSFYISFLSSFHASFLSSFYASFLGSVVASFEKMVKRDFLNFPNISSLPLMKCTRLSSLPHSLRILLIFPRLTENLYDHKIPRTHAASWLLRSFFNRFLSSN